MKTVAFAAALSALSALPAAAVPVSAELSFTGSFAADDDVALFDIVVEDVRSFVSIRTVSYAGGTLANGTEVPAGGFDPVVSLFDGSGALVGFNGDAADAALDPATGEGFDAFLRRPVDPGAYTVALTQYDNFPAGDALAAGFDEAGDPSFTAAFFCDAGQFCDFTGADRTADYALDVSIAPVPLPAAAWLLGGALLGLGLARRR